MRFEKLLRKKKGAKIAIKRFDKETLNKERSVKTASQRGRSINSRGDNETFRIYVIKTAKEQYFSFLFGCFLWVWEGGPSPANLV